MKIKNRLNKKINKISKKQQTNINQVWYYLIKKKEIKTKGRLKMMALNIGQLKINKNTKSHIWNRHRLHKKHVMEALNHGILDVIEEDDERIAVFTKQYFLLIIDRNNNLVTAFQSNPKQYKKYLEKFLKQVDNT